MRQQSTRIANAQSCMATRLCVALMLAVLLGRLGSGVAQVRTNTANERAKTSLEEVVVTATRHLTDEQVTKQVEKALANDPYVYAEHVTVTTNNGVVRLEGIVGDTGERFRMLRLCRKLPGARRVVDALELFNNDPDGG
jgi:osmotically-inducible protein OsmY